MKRDETTPLMTAKDSNLINPAEGSETMPIQPASSAGGLSPAVQKHIGNLLKVSYQDLLTEPVPDRFSSLLDQLAQAEKQSGGDK